MKSLAPRNMNRLYFTLLLVVTYLYGCKSHNFDTSPSQAELSAVKDSYYYLLMDYALDSEGAINQDQYAFYVCHIYQDTPEREPATSKYCTNAFATADGEPVVFPKAVVEYARHVGDLRDRGLAALETGTIIHNLTAFSSMAVLVIPALIASTKNLQHLVRIGKSAGKGRDYLLMAFGWGGAFGVHKLLQNANNPSTHLSHKFSETIASEEFRKAANIATQSGKVDYSKLEDFIRKHNIQNPENRLQIIITGNTRKEAGKFFQTLNAEDKTATFVKAKIPDMLPLVAQMAKDLKWADNSLAQHCLPKRDIEAQIPAMCISLADRWNTGSPLHYNKPVDRYNPRMP